MSNIFSKTNNFVDKPNRNVFDLSFQNNATFEFGKLYPVLCKEVLPGDSFNIDATFGLKFMPFYWPVQTRMKANLHFFYVRRRNLWKDFVDFWGNTKDGLVPPYLSFSDRTMLETGELADYLGVPTNLYGLYGATIQRSIEWSLINNNEHNWLYLYSNGTISDGSTVFVGGSTAYADIPDDVVAIVRDSALSNLSYLNFDDINFTYRITGNPHGCMVRIFNATGDLLAYSADATTGQTGQRKFWFKNTTWYNADGDSLTGTKLVELLDKPVTVRFIVYVDNSMTLDSNFDIYPLGTSISSDVQLNNVEVANVDQINPYLPSNSNGKILISAEPFRAYEAIYNAFYRNPQNNPYILNGVKEYNKYIPTNEGGLDNNSYKLHYRNWEQDFLTSATQTPQQGDFAPLVGITSTGQMTFQDNDGNIYKAYADVDDDGTIKGLKVGETGLPVGTLHALVDSISTGISINDFRNVNSLQRWLEKNLRRGYRFKDQIMSHFGVDVRYDELDMPEFIGGCSQDVSVNQISNTNGDGDTPLGEYAGQASCVGTTRNAVSHYFDEPGYVMAIMSITPVPNYSQLLPKYLIKRNLFDYYFPEFGHIGPQPILMNEVCPIQQYSEDPSKLNKVFGYQRAWYDYLASVDEVHGYFRTQLRNFLVNRRFDTAPELSESFLLCDPNQINDIFQVTDSTHKILGQIYFDIKAKRPIPEFGIPKLE